MKDNAPISSLLTALKDTDEDEERPTKRQKTEEGESGVDGKGIGQLF